MNVISQLWTQWTQFGRPVSAQRVCVVQRQNKRDYMEDEFDSCEHACCRLRAVAVYDGHAGGAASKYLKQNFLRLVHANLHNLCNSQNAQQSHESQQFQAQEARVIHLLRDAVRQVDSQIMSLSDSGSTLLAFVSFQGKFYCVNVGDSRAVVVDSDIVFTTIDHKPHYEAERIFAMGGSVDYFDVPRINGGLSLSRTIGDRSSRGRGLVSTPDIFVVDARNGVLLMATDGLWDVLTNAEAATYLARFRALGYSLQASLDQLVSIAIQRQSGDNITVLAVPLSQM